MSTFDTSPHVLRPQQERSRAALAKIVQAAEKILRKNGIDGFSMAAVAEAADLPVGNIYRRFKGKDELLQAIKHDVVANREGWRTVPQQATCPSETRRKRRPGAAR